YLIASAQGGRHENGRHTHGHTMIIDPWGRILAELPRGEGVVTAELDPEWTDSVRSGLPALAHRVIR
ncbi:carbon-nitrogen hydrolase family protein, partial [Chromobacterium piscinae]